VSGIGQIINFNNHHSHPRPHALHQYETNAQLEYKVNSYYNVNPDFMQYE
jgi:hypothetical protein